MQHSGGSHKGGEPIRLEYDGAGKVGQASRRGRPICSEGGAGLVAGEPEAGTDGTTQAAQAQPPEAVCKVCRKPIPAGAVKCVACGSYQDWRRFLFSWTALISAVVGVLTALVALFTPIFTPIYQRVFPPQVAPAKVAISFERCLSDSIVMITRNTGGQTAIVGRPSFHIFEDGSWQPVSTRLLSERDDPFDQDDDGEAQVNETDSQIYPNNLGGFFVTNPIPPGCNIRATVPILQGGAEGEREVTRECPCGFVAR
jgi:hypothetical protein